MSQNHHHHQQSRQHSSSSSTTSTSAIISIHRSTHITQHNRIPRPVLGRLYYVRTSGANGGGIRRVGGTAFHPISLYLPTFLAFIRHTAYLTTPNTRRRRRNIHPEWVVGRALFIRGISECGVRRGSYDREKPARLYCAGSPTRLDGRGVRGERKGGCGWFSGWWLVVYDCRWFSAASAANPLL